MVQRYSGSGVPIRVIFAFVPFLCLPRLCPVLEALDMGWFGGEMIQWTQLMPLILSLGAQRRKLQFLCSLGKAWAP